MSRRSLTATAALAVLVAPFAFAQAPTDPPPIIQLVRKPGSGGAAGMRRYADARAAVDVVGMASITGEPETWFVEMHYSFASIEDLDKGLAAVAPMRDAGDAGDPFRDDVLAPARTIISELRPEWSYRADQAIRTFPRARYFHVSVYRIRAGTEADFGELIKLRRMSQDSINLDRPELAYQVISGAPAGTFIFLAPLVSLRSLDEGVPNTPVYAESIAHARSQARAKTAPDSELSREHLFFRVEPRLSYVSDEFASADTAFWRPKADRQ